MMATHEFVVPKSMPTMSARAADEAWKSRDERDAPLAACPSRELAARSISRDRHTHANHHV